MDALNLAQLLGRFDDHWSPKTIAGVNDYDVKLVKVAGEFVWHTHPHTDELFLVLSGRLTIQLRESDVVLEPGELFVVPRGIEHCPRAESEAAALLLEPRSVVNTGDTGGELTATAQALVWPGDRIERNCCDEHAATAGPARPGRRRGRRPPAGAVDACGHADQHRRRADAP